MESVQHERFNLLVFGGSQGAHVLNRTMLERSPSSRASRTRSTSSTRPAAARSTRCGAGYEKARADAEVHDFIRDMSAAYAQADAIVCRAGATTLAELTVAKKAAILVPFAAAADNHQEINARSLVQAGAAVMIPEKELSGERRAKEIFASMNTERRQQMEKAACHLGRPEAAREIADVLVELSERRWGKGGRKA